MASEGIEAEAEARRLLRMARADDSPAARQLRARARLQTAVVPIFTLCAAVLVAWAWYVRTYVFPNDALDTGYSYAISLMFVALVPIFAWSQVSGWARKTELAMFELRKVAAAGDERMPGVIDQPAPLDEAELGTERRFKPLSWHDKEHPGWQQVSVILLLLLIFAPSLISVSPGWAWTGPLAFLRPIFRPLPAIPWYALYSVFYIALLYYWLARAAGMTVTADAQGIRWTTGRLRKRAMQIAWHEVRSFTRLEFRHKWSPKPNTTFVLDCGRAILSWGYDPIWRSGELPAEAGLLARTIVTRTGIPLRQATPYEAEVLREAGTLPLRWWERRLQMPRGVAAPLPGLATAFRLLSPTPTVRRVLVLLACLPLILYMGYGVASLVPR